MIQITIVDEECCMVAATSEKDRSLENLHSGVVPLARGRCPNCGKPLCAEHDRQFIWDGCFRKARR